jgi:hypothetical protein
VAPTGITQAALGAAVEAGMSAAPHHAPSITVVADFRALGLFRDSADAVLFTPANW